MKRNRLVLARSKTCSKIWSKFTFPPWTMFFASKLSNVLGHRPNRLGNFLPQDFLSYPTITEMSVCLQSEQKK